MKILIAPDSFKNALPALEVAEAIGRGIRRSMPDAGLRILPMADGGEGTVNAVIHAKGGRRITASVHDPLMRKVEAAYGITADGRTAVIEMAAASGIQLVGPQERNPWIATSYGTGELIREALDQGCRDIILGIGGSATNDCGTGMAEALGAKFLGPDEWPVPRGGGALDSVSRIEVGEMDPRLKETRVVAACDVANPLTGPEGASRVYAPQKGADRSTAEKLDRNLKLFARLIQRQLGRDVENVQGAGAAGGLGAGLMAFLDAELVEGVQAVAGLVGLEKAVKWADLVITGEGSLDGQTRYGKTPCGVARISKKYGRPVIALAGNIGRNADTLREEGINAIFPIIESPMGLKEAIRNTARLLENAGQRIGNFLTLEKHLRSGS